MSVSVSLPDRLLGRSSTGATNQLIFRDPVPALDVRPRDARKAVAFLGMQNKAGPAQSPVPAEDAAASSWYHTLEFPDGTVTPGQFDHRPLVSRYGLPTDLAGKTALDVATFDGFWAFEMERRGADVTALDLDSAEDFDLPAEARREFGDAAYPAMGSGFALAHEALGSRARRVAGSVYDLAESGLGPFDLVHVGDLLLHLRRPLAALEAVRAVTAHQALIVDVVDLDPYAGPFGPVMHYSGGWDDVTWWVPSLSALGQLVIDAGFSRVQLNAVYYLTKTHESSGYWRASISAFV
jgi:tRNA (mo5U34)-methyltransferase